MRFTMAKKSTPAPSPKPMTVPVAARIQSAEARIHGGKVSGDGFAARAQRAAAHNDGGNN
jgi:hypothetical protein